MVNADLFINQRGARGEAPNSPARKYDVVVFPIQSVFLHNFTLKIIFQNHLTFGIYSDKIKNDRLKMRFFCNNKRQKED